MIVQEIPEVSVVERIQEQIVETIEVVPQERSQQCTIAPTMHVVTREQFHNDVEHPPRRKVRFATEDDIQIIADSSRRAEVSEITRALALHSWSAMALSSFTFISSVMISKPELQSSSSSPSSPSKSSGCRALQALRRTREAPPVHEDTGKAVCRRSTWFISWSNSWSRSISP